MYITIGVIAHNEERAITGILNDILNQDYPHNRIEVVLVDCASTDKTKKIMQEFALNNALYPDGNNVYANDNVIGAAGKKQAGECDDNAYASDIVKMSRKREDEFKFASVQVLDNPKKTQPSGWNVVLRSFSGEAVIRIDAHASIPADFVSKNVAALESGENVVGGVRPNMTDEPTKWKETLLLAESSMFGSSIAPYRNDLGKTYVKSMFHAAYRREVFEKVGLFNEKLIRTEDNEMHYRIRQAGYKLMYDSTIVSYQHTRSTLLKMLKQKYANGYWIGLTSAVCPECLSLYHFVPFAFVAAIILSLPGILVNRLLLPAFNLIYMLTCTMWGLYGMLAVVMTILAVISAKEKANITNIFLPFLFLLLHLSYGIGTLAGFINLPRWLKNYKNED